MMECPCTYYIGLTVRTDHQLSLCFEINHCDTMSCTGLTITTDCPSIWCTPCFTVRTDVILSIALETNHHDGMSLYRLNLVYGQDVDLVVYCTFRKNIATQCLALGAPPQRLYLHCV